jgi:hypothetical protein
MASRKFATNIIIFNLVICFLIFLSIQLPLLDLSSSPNWLSFRVGNPYFVFIVLITVGSGPQPRDISVIYPNFPLLLFICSLIGNAYYLFRLRRSAE